MAQLITKFGYLKDNKTRSRGGYAKYIATREGVEAPGVEGYMEYMATRPRAERLGSHGLFTTAGEQVKLRELQEQMEALPEIPREFAIDMFNQLVEKIVPISNTELTYRLKCGLELKEVIHQ